MGNKKQEFNINNFNFKIVEMNVFNYTETIIMKYYLLVDEMNFIHDYKVIYERVEVKNITTRSHKKKKSKNITLDYRIWFIEELGLEHKYQNKNEHNKRKKSEYFDYDHINKTNINSNNSLIRYRDVTFQNIIYILLGSNPKGEGKNIGTLFTQYKNEKINFGFFLQCLNVTKQISSKFININYETAWQNKEIKSIMFTEWLDGNDEIRKLFIQFNLRRENWKEIKSNFEKSYKLKRTNFINLETKVNKLRTEQKKNIQNKFGILDINNVINDYFSTNSTKFEYAHIKPVWYIKYEFNKKKDENILNQISDPYNFLPLPSTVHNLYDSYYFYWEEDGKMNKLKNNLNMNDVHGYTQINEKQLKNSRYFLKEYKKVIEYIKK